MADLEFEARLERLFAQPPAMADNEAFARRVEDRLNRGWGLRQLLIWVIGLGGGILGATQLITSGALVQFERVSESDVGAATQTIQNAWRSGVVSADAMSMPFSGEVIWMAAALGAIALAFAVTRAVEEF